MDFYDIESDHKVSPGEYLLYKPRMEIVLCSAFIPTEGIIKALAQGRMIKDQISQFRKIRLSSQERKRRSASRCKGCSGS